MQGQLKKMHAHLDKPVQYELPLNDQKIALNPLIGKLIKLVHTGQIFCVYCNKLIKKSYNQGYCYPCFIKLAQCDMCIMKPHTCHYAAGTCREPLWGDEFCFQPHFVYLANSSDIKVGITRHTQTPTRWIDQGATQALPIFRTQSRFLSGLIEVAISKHISDKTNWQKMLKSPSLPIDLITKRDELLSLCNADIQEITQHFEQQAVEFLADGQVVDIHFPVSHYPTKIKSLCLIKTPEISGVLQGIKGQYMLLDTGVLNIRKYTGYEIEFLA
ncbi:MAG: DUF2797 domain-containing protein [Methylovulum sp.]|nr:DUF2797 domain-containing protein [Methylovulum sp.]